MGDPSEFANITEYSILMCAVGLLILSECLILFFTSKGSRDSRKKSDRGTIWLVMMGWSMSLVAGVYFRSRFVPAMIQNWLLPDFSYYIGVFLIAAGIAIRCTAVLTLKKAFTLSVQTTENQHLITTGLYRFVRNPAYTGSIISLLGVAFAYRHILAIISVLVICILCYGIRISVEEQALKEQFKEEFEQYCSATKYRVIPFIF